MPALTLRLNFHYNEMNKQIKKIKEENHQGIFLLQENKNKHNIISISISLAKLFTRNWAQKKRKKNR